MPWKNIELCICQMYSQQIEKITNCEELQQKYLPKVITFVVDSNVMDPLPQKYVPRSKILFVPSSSTRNCSVLHELPSP